MSSVMLAIGIDSLKEGLMSVLSTSKEGSHLVISHEYPTARKFFALARVAIGWLFLWSFLDRLFGFGFSTDSPEAWVQGGSPTSEFLELQTSGPLESFFQSLAGSVWVDWVFMIGLLGIGLALMLGIGVRIAAVAGTALLVLLWAATLLPEQNPFMTERLVYALVLIGLAWSDSGETWGFGRSWKQTTLVQRFPFLT